MEDSAHSGTRARVVILAGPSGAGKSRLAARLATAYGWPVIRLDDFYKDLDDPSLPLQPDLGIADWDDPRSWRADDALTALTDLVERGEATVPDYDISVSRSTGSHTITCDPGHLLLAEGIFAAEVVGTLRDRGLLHSAWCISQGANLTFIRRLVRDLAERRKPPLVLLKRGLALRAAEPATVARHVQLGAREARPADVERRLAARVAPLG